MISFASRAVDCVGVAEKPGLRRDRQVAEPAGVLDEIRDLPVALVRACRKHRHGTMCMSITRRSLVKLRSGTKPCSRRAVSSTEK